MAPPYAFNISPMAPRRGIVERWSPHGRWRPPKAFGNNVSGEPIYFVFDGHTTVNTGPPQTVEEHRTYSIYHDRAIFWTVDYDATKEQVSDGSESSPEEDTPEETQAQFGFQDQSAASSDVDDSDDEDDEDQSERRVEKDDWAPLKFDHRDRDLLSYAGRHQPFSRLRVRRPDQEWPSKLLTDTCSARDTSREPRHGGLIGELPLLIALMAFAIPANELVTKLCEAMGRTWRAPRCPREAGWDDKRGFVITTYAYPPHSRISDLTNYEQGQYGNILP